MSSVSDVSVRVGKWFGRWCSVSVSIVMIVKNVNCVLGISGDILVVVYSMVLVISSSGVS